MIRVAVAGAAGRMGGRIINAVCASDQAELAGAFEAPGHSALDQKIAVIAGCPNAPGFVASDPARAVEAADVLIDFTAPEATLANLDICARASKAAVVGTTGMQARQIDQVKQYAQDIPLVMAPNMSVGMNLMFKLVGQMAEVLGDEYALELVEAHHDQKKDAPSGTAVRLIAELCRVRGWDPEEATRHGRQGMVGARTNDELGVSVIRGGDIVGDHTVYFVGHGERLELTHRAHSRDTFARGALRAALWVVGREPGLYDMADVLGLN
jgi:4-hydroxy-tetrahydrodipicolinate reductase